jgi:hypothetical protein
VFLTGCAKMKTMFTSPRILFLLLLPCLVVSLMAQDAFPPTTLARQEAAATMKPFPQNGIVMLKTIAGDFASNESAAIGKYSGHRITVVGRIANLDKGSGEDTAFIVTLQDASANLPSVKAKFLPGSIPENSEIEISQDGLQAILLKRNNRGMILERRPYLSVDQRIGITGDFEGLQVGDIVLSGCELASKNKIREAGKKPLGTAD